MAADREALGWTPEHARALAALGDPALEGMRVVLAERGAWRVSDGREEVTAGVPGRLRHRSAARDMPVVGDWVAVRRTDADAALIEAVLPRRTVLIRRDPDGKSEQVLVAGVDRAVIVMGLDHDYNLRRLERFLALVGAAGVRPIVVLSKPDLHPAAERPAEVAAAAPGVPVLALCLLEPAGPQAVGALLAPGETAVLLGSSGAGKSTLLNGLLGEAVQRTAPVRGHDSRGRHTTTRRQLFLLPGGAMLIDTPGLRELDPVEAAAGLEDAFADVLAVAAGCRFRDCRHEREPDCAVRTALAEGRLDPARVEGWRKLSAGGAPGPGRRR